ncbi:YdbC family protein [Halobacillus rhizosphaerae]|uniref:YdbC family protein n=1 Tax=Halobacillus rhizosphaerae TaxID=3064889 RepID=UPI00398A580A
MIIKKISCQVHEHKKPLFSRAQEEWKEILPTAGFLGQLGGWSLSDPFTANIFAFWEEEASYESFMNEAHDRIYHNSGQENTYFSIDTELFQVEQDLLKGMSGLRSLIQKARYIRTAFTQVKENRINHFLDMQRNVWNPGMKRAEGMIGGVVCRSQRDFQSFLIFTGWENHLYHQMYRLHLFPHLKHKAAPQQDVNHLSGESFPVEEGWRVVSSEY